MSRSGKWYRKNEAEVMEGLGLNPTRNSGSGWIEKEDGQSERLIAQLKSTDKESIKLSKLDLDKLNYNASVSHKVPVFVIQFIQANEEYLIIKRENLKAVSDELGDSPECSMAQFKSVLVDFPAKNEKLYIEGKKSISGASDARQAFHEEREMKYRKDKKAK